MKVVKHLIAIFTGVILFTACQKEYSLDTGILPGVLATGTLKDSLGDCQPITINGNYFADSTLKDSSYVTVQVNVTSAGSYIVSSDTANGFSFKDSGYFSTTGLKTLKLKGAGKPTVVGPADFLVTFGTSFCIFSVNVLQGTGTPSTPSTTLDYFPITANSFWSYTFDVTADTVRYTVAPANVLINSISYRPFKIQPLTGGGDSLYYRKASGVYSEYGDIDPVGALDSVFEFIDYPFLKDNVAVNSTWESNLINAYSKNSRGKAKAQFTILAKDVQQTINGVSVDSVIKVQRTILFQATGSSTFTNLGSFNFYYANHKGLLLVDGNLPATINPLPIAVPFKLEAKKYQVF